MENLKTMGYPVDGLAFDPNLVHYLSDIVGRDFSHFLAIGGRNGENTKMARFETILHSLKQ